MAGLILIDKSPRAISEDSKQIINELIKKKVIKVSIVNSDNFDSQANAFLKKMQAMRLDLTTSSKARTMAEKLERQIRANDGAFSLAQARERPQTLTELL